jgi:hypothetical protein
MRMVTNCEPFHYGDERGKSMKAVKLVHSQESVGITSPLHSKPLSRSPAHGDLTDLLYQVDC